MVTEVRAATDFNDVRTMLGPKRDPEAKACWCLGHRLGGAAGPGRSANGAEIVRGLCAQDPPPGVLAYEGDEVVGWAGVHPRADTALARSRTIPHVDDLAVWSVWCIRVRAGFRGKGISHALLAGAVEFAQEYGAPAIEGYPLDNRGRTTDRTAAYVGTRALFERAGFTKAADTGSVLAGFPRVLMRLDLR
ncbi:GNAT family N-acetyltransferase [Paeniglutamicibacter sp. MACA_103]|uniref:GNAT family N-acetyltransferase n=1 Tax=Paeniglutamicibacter sp. MACA_103 TaxID=3377337 RepID=UPI003894113F